MTNAPLVYSVLGGCTTRDAAELGADPLPRPVRYFSRTRIQSIVSAPSPIDASAIRLDSGFQRRVIVQDHDKSVARLLAETDHPIVIDLLGERAGLRRTGHGIVTSSQYYRQAGLHRKYRTTRVREDTRLRRRGGFAKAVARFAEILPDQPVVIHRSYWATTDVRGRILENASRGEAANTWLERAYRILETALGDRARPVEVPAAHRVADPDHKWGASALHFPTSYYEELSHRIRETLLGHHS